MNYCRISLKRVENSSKYSCYKDLEFKKLFSSLKVNPVLGFSRKDFFKQSPVKSKGMSISGMQQKLSMKIDKTNELVVTAKQGEYIPIASINRLNYKLLSASRVVNPWLL